MNRVAVDLDNVVVSILDSARAAAARRAGVDPSSVVDTWAYHAPFDHPDPAVAALLATDHDFWQDERMLSEAPPLPGAVDALRGLADAGMLAAYVTRRPESRRRVTQDWIARAGAPRVRVVMVGDEAAGRNHALCKADACDDVGATHLVDDSQDEAARALARGIVPVLVDHPLGRVARAGWLSTNPGVALARDLADAVRMLTGTRAA